MTSSLDIVDFFSLISHFIFACITLKMKIYISKIKCFDLEKKNVLQVQYLYFINIFTITL
jgi:hypothetical protein